MRETQLTACLKEAFKGRRRAIKSAELERSLHISGTDLRKVINQLRRKSIPICSSQDGYFYAKTAGDIVRTIRKLERMIQGLQAAVDGLTAALDQFEAPPGLPSAARQNGGDGSGT